MTGQHKSSPLVRETAEWIDGRADVLEQIAARANKTVAGLLRIEAARHRGRANLIRLMEGIDPLPHTQAGEGRGQ